MVIIFSRLSLVEHYRQFGRTFPSLSDQTMDHYILISQVFRRYHVVWDISTGIETKESIVAKIIALQRSRVRLSTVIWKCKGETTKHSNSLLEENKQIIYLKSIHRFET